MEERKTRGLTEEYVRVVSGIIYYLKKKNTGAICKYKCPLFAAGGDEGRIELLSNSLEHMGSLCGHKKFIDCLSTLSSIILASGSKDKSIKIWDIEKRAIMSTLCGHTKKVNALCGVREGVLVSGSEDYFLFIWSKSPRSSTYSHRQTLTGHTSAISGIIKISNTEIMSGEQNGDLMMWDIDQGICTRHIPNMEDNYDFLTQMKQHTGER